MTAIVEQPRTLCTSAHTSFTGRTLPFPLSLSLARRHLYTSRQVKLAMNIWRTKPSKKSKNHAHLYTLAIIPGVTKITLYPEVPRPACHMKRSVCEQQPPDTKPCCASFICTDKHGHSLGMGHPRHQHKLHQHHRCHLHPHHRPHHILCVLVQAHAHWILPAA